MVGSSDQISALTPFLAPGVPGGDVRAGQPYPQQWKPTPENQQSGGPPAQLQAPTRSEGGGEGDASEATSGSLAASLII